MNLQAGACAVEISPPAGTPLFGFPHVPRRSTGVHDPLLASALVLRSGPITQVQIALDLLMLAPPDARVLRRRVADALGTTEPQVFISCTHTHSGPVCCGIIGWAGDVAAPAPAPDVIAAVIAGAVAAARGAAACLRPAVVAWTTAAVTGVGGNRHDPAAVADPEAGILVVRDRNDGTPLAICTVYGMHPTVLHEDSTLVSSDFPHYVRLHLKACFGDGLVVVYHNGPCGNQSPRHEVRGQTFAEAERLGRRLGGLIAGAVGIIPDAEFNGAPELAGAIRAFRPRRRVLPVLAAAEQMLADYRTAHTRLKDQGASRADIRTAECAVFGAEGLVNLARAQASGDLDRLLRAYAPLEAQALRIGDSGLIGLPGELFAEYGLQIKRTASARVFIVAFTNGELQGYITTPEAAAVGGYEAAGAVFDCRTGKTMVRTALALACDLGIGLNT